MWYGAGASLVRRLGSSGCEIIPAVSGLQLAAARLVGQRPIVKLSAFMEGPLKQFDKAIHEPEYLYCREWKARLKSQIC